VLRRFGPTLAAKKLSEVHGMDLGVDWRRSLGSAERPTEAHPPTTDATSLSGRAGADRRFRALVVRGYRAWLDNLPSNLESSMLADKPQAIVELGLEALQEIDPPRGYGRD
jgi:hypothetical protein